MEILMTFERICNKILGNNIFIIYGFKLDRLLTKYCYDNGFRDIVGNISRVFFTNE